MNIVCISFNIKYSGGLQAFLASYSLSFLKRLLWESIISKPSSRCLNFHPLGFFVFFFF